MNKSILKWIIIIITIFIFIYAFSASYSSQNMDHLDYVVALGIDSSDNPDKIKVIFQFVDISSFSSKSSSEESTPILDTITATSIDSAINIMNAYAGKKVNLSHCKVVVFSEELAKRGIYNEVSDLINNAQIRPTVNVAISTADSKDYIENSTSSLEKILTKYYDIFPSSSKYTGYTSNVTIGEFYENLKNTNIGSTAIFGGTNEASIKNKENSQSTSNSNSSSNNSSTGGGNSGSSGSSNSSTGNENPTSQQNQTTDGVNTTSGNSSSSTSVQNMTAGNSSIVGERGTENIGLAVFKDVKYVGNLTAMQTLCHSIITDEVDSFLLSIPDPFGSGNLIDLSIEKISNSNIKINTSGDFPIIDLDISLTGRILSISDSLDYSDKATLDKIQLGVKDYLTSQISEYLYKTSKELDVDINGFYTAAKRNFLTIEDLNNYNWEKKYKNAEFNIKVDANIVSSLLVQNN